MSIPKPAKYIADFEQLGLGLFIHWGLYSQLGQGEWICYMKNMEQKEYQKLKDTFTAEDFDAEELVLMAKNAGFRYITLTSRHHEGFSLFDTCGMNDYDAVHSPAGRDLIREFVDACHKHGIVPFMYHTTLDWYKEEFNTDFDAYLEYLKDSVQLLCTNYGKIGGLWFDGNWSRTDVDWKEGELYGMIRSHQPEAIIINNTGLSARGQTGHPEIDAVTYENDLAAPPDRTGMEKYVAGEMCHTINDHWGYGQNDLNYKSPADLIEHLCNCRKIGANYLMNIGPEAQGGINSFQKELLKMLGRWMEVFGEAIYNGRPHCATSDGRSFILKSVEDDCLYLFIFDLGIEGDSNVTVKGKRLGNYSFGNVTEKIASVEWMDNGEQLKFTLGDGLLAINATGYPYGTSYVVRVAKAKLEK